MYTLFGGPIYLIFTLHLIFVNTLQYANFEDNIRDVMIINNFEPLWVATSWNGPTHLYVKSNDILSQWTPIANYIRVIEFLENGNGNFKCSLRT